MSQDTPLENTNKPAVAGTPPVEHGERVFLVSYPKIVFLYPTVITAIFCATFMWAKGGIPEDEIHARSQATQSIMRASATATDEAAKPAADAAGAASPETAETAETAATSAPKIVHTYHHNCARIFLIVFALNMVVISFDFPRTTSLTWFFAISAIVIGLWFLFTMNPGIAPKILAGILSIKPVANASFYIIYSFIMLFLYVWVLISRRFDYWRVAQRPRKPADARSRRNQKTSSAR